MYLVVICLLVSKLQQIGRFQVFVEKYIIGVQIFKFQL